MVLVGWVLEWNLREGVWRGNGRNCYARFATSPQYENLSYIGDTYSCTSNKKLVYIAVNGSIIALDYQSGKVVWKNDDYTVSCGPVCIDKNGTIYASCAELLEIIIINNDGKTVKKLNGIEEGFSIGSGEGFW